MEKEMTNNYQNKGRPKKNAKRQRLEAHIYHHGPKHTGQVAEEFNISTKQAGNRLTISPDIYWNGFVKIETEYGTWHKQKVWYHIKTQDTEYLREVFHSKKLDQRSARKIKRFFKDSLEETLEEE